MNTVILLSYVALAVNFVSGNIEFSTMGRNRIIDIIGRHVSDISLREDAGIGQPKPQTKDAVHFEDQQVYLCGPILCISANLTKGSLTGVTGYDILKFNFVPNGKKVTIDADILFPKLELDAEYYEMEGSIMQALPLAGRGKLHLETTDLRIWTTILLQVTDHTSIESFENSGFSIASILSRTEFDGNIDGIFNAMVDELLAERLNRFNKVIAAYYGEILKDFLNPILN